MLSTDHEYLAELRSTSTMLLQEAIGGVRDVALLDIPNQRNVGDSLIWAGEVAYLQRMGLRVRYAADRLGYRAEDLRAAMPNGVVLLHGGGNIGDLWPAQQKHREEVVAELHDYRIVQLPQSILFNSREAAAHANSVMAAHPDLTLLLRDHESIERARVDLPDINTAFCYDMALGCQLTPRQGSNSAVLIIGRRDVEGRSGLADVGPGWLSDVETIKTDWGPLSGWLGLKWRFARATSRLNHYLVYANRRLGTPRIRPLHPLAMRAVSSINRTNIESAVRTYSRARVAVVDRLHAHILAVLLDVEHVVLDNSYRKIGSVYDEYSGRASTAHYATNLDDARSCAERLLAG